LDQAIDQNLSSAFPQYFPDEQSAVAALKRVMQAGGVILGKSGMFGENNPFYTDAHGQKIHVNPNGHLAPFALPAVLAHEGVHLSLRLPGL